MFNVYVSLTANHKTKLALIAFALHISLENIVWLRDNLQLMVNQDQEYRLSHSSKQLTS